MNQVENGIDFANHYNDYKLCKYFSHSCLLGPTNKINFCGAVRTDCYAFEKFSIKEATHERGKAINDTKE